MKICFAVCEYDPLHFGHVHHIKQMKNAGFDAVVVIMSGNFTQRGEIAILDKFTRAKHAILAGADLVVELPTVFATSNSEIFARGGVKIANSLGGSALCFGTEIGSKQDFLDVAKLMINETKEFKQELKIELSSGVPFAQARANALTKTSNVNLQIFSNPNSILGLEYTKAILLENSPLEIMPIERVGNGYKSKQLNGEFCSASAIRGAISSLKLKKVKKFVPEFVYNDLPKTLPDISKPLIYSLLQTPLSQMKNVVDCTEGLENRIKVVAKSATNFCQLIDRLETKRYTRARLQRVTCQTMLGISKQLVEKCLKGDVYARVLAVDKDKTDVLSYLAKACEKSGAKLITRRSDMEKLGGYLEKSLEIDNFASDIFHLVTGQDNSQREIKIIERK